MARKNLSLRKRSSNRESVWPSVWTDEIPKSPAIYGEGWVGSSFRSFAKLYVPSADMDLDWRPSVATVFKILFSFRVSAAMWSTINDCDEVYNYWEPLHFFLYGNGFQTWEYSPIYAVRSYIYVLVHFIPGYLLKFLLSWNKIGVFITLRCILGLFSVCSELALYKALCDRFSNGIARIYVALTIASSGMFISCCAFLPSSFSMCLNTFAMAFYINGNWFLSIFCTATSALIGWPFATILGLPIVIEMLIFRDNLWMLFFNYSFFCGGALVVLLIAVDSYFYGRAVLAPLNIVLYNLFSPNGPDLYGTEDITYYVKNLLLNWTIAIPILPFAVPFACFAFVQCRSSRYLSQRIPIKLNMVYWERFLPLCLISISVFLWLIIFFLQPHKEERFLFPVYPLIALQAATSLDAIPRVGSFFFGTRSRKFWNVFVVIFLCLFFSLSISRSAALHRNFSAPNEIFKELNNHLNSPSIIEKMNSPSFSSGNGSDIHVCVGKEWYRFPSSFFIPSNIFDEKGKNWSVMFSYIKSEFSGILPKPFASYDIPAATRNIPSHMNDQNMEEPSRYIPIHLCTFLVDLESLETTVFEPNFALQNDVWKSVIRKPFLLSSYSHPILRIFYVPFFADKGLRFGTYHLLERVAYDR